ncbi:MAG TPA: hypothetical protein VEJ18_10810, partial [Planctomycetota bacterium]|nr:hypothetical protein [Planctomycetota bacterium]
GSRPPKDPAARRLEVVGAPAGATLDELRRFQARLSPRAVRQMERVHDGLRHHLVPPPPKPQKLVLDVDRPEIRLGRKGRATALVCFDGAHGEFWKARLGAGRGEVPFLKECLSKVPGGFARGRVQLRLDPSFASEPVVRYLDRAGVSYVAPAADDKALRADARKARLREISGGWAVGEMERRLHPIRATKGRYVVLRRRSSKKADGPAPTFADGRHAYHVFLVDRRTTPARAWAAWSERAASLQAERALLKGFGESPLLGRDRRSRAASFATYVLGSDVLQWFKRAGLPEKERVAGHEALRTDLLMLAPPGGKRETAVLVLPKKDRRRRLYRKVADRLSRLRPAGAFKLGR